jgi:hypothetical protein
MFVNRLFKPPYIETVSRDALAYLSCWRMVVFQWATPHASMIELLCSFSGSGEHVSVIANSLTLNVKFPKPEKRNWDKDGMLTWWRRVGASPPATPNGRSRERASSPLGKDENGTPPPRCRRRLYTPRVLPPLAPIHKRHVLDVDSHVRRRSAREHAAPANGAATPRRTGRRGLSGASELGLCSEPFDLIQRVSAYSSSFMKWKFQQMGSSLTGWHGFLARFDVYLFQYVYAL